MTLKNALLGALLVVQDSQAAVNTDNTSELPFFLPLCICAEPDCKESALLDRGPRMPLHCETTLSERWRVIYDLLCDPNTIKVLFHMQIALIPVLQSIYDWNRHVLVTTDSNEVIRKGVFPRVFDPKLAQYLLDSDVTDDDLEWHSLLNCYGLSNSPSTTSVSLGQVSRSLELIAFNVNAALTMFRFQGEALMKQGLTALLWRIESPVSCLLSAMELQGVHIDTAALEAMKDGLQTTLQDLTIEIYRESKFEFNILSPEQVSHVLFDKLALRSDRVPAGQGGSHHSDEPIRSKSGKFLSTSEEELKKLVNCHPVVKKILDFRALSKLKSTYIEGLRALVDTSNHAVHAYWNQTSVRTGRLSCCKPNLQNIPNDECVRNTNYSIRGLFIARPRKVFVSADYSQIEMRVLAHVSGDGALCELFRSRGGDVYRQLASRIFRKPVDTIEPDERNRAKVIALGVVYGMGPQAAAARLNIDVVTAAKISNSFLNSFPQVRTWIQKVKLMAKQVGHVKTILGRIRQLPDINLIDDAKRRSAAERQAVNSIIQGSASDLIKFAMILTSDRLMALVSSSGLFPNLIMQIHDELIFEVPVDSVAYMHSVITSMIDVLENDIVNRLEFRVPLVANVSIGKSWGGCVDWSLDSSNQILQSLSLS
jgi:DNA polymerase I